MILDPDLIEFLIWIPVLSILDYIPLVCWLDTKCREVQPVYWAPLVAINMPGFVVLYLTGTYPWYSLAISLVMCFIFWAMAARLIGGTDYIFMCLISLFFVVSPLPYPPGHNGLMQPMFYCTLILCMMVTCMAVFAYNWIAGNRWTFWKMIQDYPRGIPFILPISAAFLLALAWG